MIAAMQKRYHSGFENGEKAGICDEYPDLWPIVDCGISACGCVVALCPSQFDAIDLAKKLNFFEELKKTLAKF